MKIRSRYRPRNRDNVVLYNGMTVKSFRHKMRLLFPKAKRAHIRSELSDGNIGGAFRNYAWAVPKMTRQDADLITKMVEKYQKMKPTRRKAITKRINAFIEEVENRKT